MHAIKTSLKNLKIPQKDINLIKTNHKFIQTKNSNKIINSFYSVNSSIYQRNILSLNKFNFSSSNQNDEDMHSDFKPRSKVEVTDENVMDMIEDWVKNNDVVLFMKGTLDAPRCGFSNLVVQILKTYNVRNVKSINILDNQIVREAVKKYSNWPTYPQLYVKGNLIGKIIFLNF